MTARVQLDRPHAHFTNLDLVTGRVILSLTSDEAVSAIIVKLEGESKTRLAGQKVVQSDGLQPSKKTEQEVHKLLYQVKEVFPSEEIKRQTSSTAGYTLATGQHEYPFQFKLPFNNNCANTNSFLTNVNFAGMRMEIARDPVYHLKAALPPSLSGFPGEAEIRYYVKATVVRPRFYQGNHRTRSNFTFFPIEPPRPPTSQEETYAKRGHQFKAGLPPVPKRKGLFSSLKSPTPPPQPSEPLRLEVDARLPHPPIITCNEALPLRMLVHRLSRGSQKIFLETIHIELIAYTNVRAHELRRTECGTWVLLSLSNMREPLGNATEEPGTPIVVDNAYWKDRPLPNTVAPSFETCNISRRYELEIKVGLMSRSIGSGLPEFIVIPLRHPVQVFSGIAPPARLLEAMAAQRNNSVRTPSRPPEKTSQGPGLAVHPPDTPLTPLTPLTPTVSANMPPRIGEHVPANVSGAGGVGEQAGPPSYEDAMAEDMAPVDGRRRDYHVSEMATDSFSEKGGGGGGGDRSAQAASGSQLREPSSTDQDGRSAATSTDIER
ncbi:MAG: hypothetical protein M1823_003082 [Watsoniomyces obsoletus]|nr:MAG: hypothetical protein M1823_003082 [Watsoniomyces obsoletus]